MAINELRSVSTFIKAAELGSLRKAALDLGISPQAASKAARAGVAASMGASLMARAASRTASQNRRISVASLMPFSLSTPELTSTASVLQRGRTDVMPSPTFALVSPPLKTR